MIKKFKSLNNSQLIKVLKLSIVLNIAFASFILGRISIETPKHRPHQHKSIIDKKILADSEKILDTKRSELINAMLEEPYNEQRVKLALEDFDKTMDNIRALFTDAIIKKAAMLPPSERIKILPPPLLKKDRYAPRPMPL